MPNVCAVPKCSTGRRIPNDKCSLFRVPKDVERYKKWLAVVLGLKQSQFVCEKHFKEQFILREWKKYDANGRIFAQVPYTMPRLDKSAVPSIFDDNDEVQQLPSHAITDVPMNEVVGTLPLRELSDVNNVDSSLMDVTDSESAQNASHEDILSQPLIIDEDFLGPSSLMETDIASTDDSVHKVPQAFIQPEIVVPNESVEFEILPISEVAAVVSNPHERTSVSVPVCSIGVATSNEDRGECFILIPKTWDVRKTSTERGRSIVFVKCVTKRESGIEVPVIEKTVVVATGGLLHYFVYGRKVDPEGCKLDSVLSRITLLPNILERFSNLNVCIGIGVVNMLHFSADSAFKDCVDRWRHKDCMPVSKRKRCNGCTTVRKLALKKERILKENHPLTRIKKASNPMDQKKILAQRKKIRKEKRSKDQAKRRVQILMQSLKEKENELAAIRTETLEERCSSLEVAPAQKAALAEILAASKKGSNNRRYSEEWIMLCMLLNIRSSTYYEFLRKNNVLPLPCKRTIRSYFSLISMKCGFDEGFGKLLKKHFDDKPPLQRHGVLLLDEINLRKSVAVCSKNLSYVGLTDFGEDGLQSTSIDDQATHGLVIMFQSLAASYTQPIAVFASKNSVKGEELSKLVVNAISFLEKNGAMIHGIIGDGASTNNKMWSLLGVSGEMGKTKTSFAHPLVDDIKVFVFSDTPHIIKCIRNRLHNKRKLRMKSSDAHICWSYFEALFDADTKWIGNARLCPRITKRHVVLDNTSKMRVRLATQIFSDSVAKGLQFYSSREPGWAFAGCEETIKFCSWMNEMFDALNRKSPNQGLTPQTDDFKVLQRSVQALDDWESAMRKGDITADEFLTPTTARGLRLTLLSTMELCRYLIEKFDFQYLLTGKVNQDNLEKFFGTIRQAAGCNDHPSSPTFLQLYKLLSVYNVIKPPKFGNCTISKETSPVLISLQELRSIYGEKSESKFIKYRRDIQQKLDETLRPADCEADDIIESDHDYALAPVLDCIIYYVTGYLCKQVLKSYNSCATCVKAVQSESSCGSSVSQFVDMKSRGGLIHANARFYHLVRQLESCFAKHASSSDVFDCTVEEFMDSYEFTFPCLEHASDILSYAIVYYIRLRMRQYAHQENLKLTKKFVVKNKLSKLTNQ